MTATNDSTTDSSAHPHLITREGCLTRERADDLRARWLRQMGGNAQVVGETTVRFAPLERITVEPGDVVVVQFAGFMTHEQKQELLSQCKRLWPENTAIVLSPGLTLESLDADALKRAGLMRIPDGE